MASRSATSVTKPFQVRSQNWTKKMDLKWNQKSRIAETSQMFFIQ